ncbi:hypothetical protein Tco_0906900 [Tanacetum coccineum]|uniref:Uncharacterized protein n=1 Tax=Tanacetum coccineum TaxID=301880 RepID=A0ABQ5CHS1_9ASTR
MCDVPLCNNPTSLEAFKEHSETIIDSNDDSTSSDDDSPYGENIDYVDASPPLMRSRYPFRKVADIEGRFKYIEFGGLSTLIRSILKKGVVAVPTTHVDFFSQYDSFIFDLSNDQFPPTDRSDLNHEEFADELAHIISPPEYDHFCFKIEPELGNLTMDVVNDIFPTREPRVHVPNVFPPQPPPVAPPYLLSCGNEDIIFDPGISIYHSFMPDVSHRSGTFIINVYPNRLNESPMMILPSTCFPMDQ